MRYKCVVQYDGSLFLGFQVQTKGRTVQKEIEQVLQQTFLETITIHPAGRTDGGVHALGQVFHFDTKADLKEWNMKKALNTLLPKDIYISSVEKVSDEFHARYGVRGKEYHYTLDLGEYNPLFRHYRYYPPFKNIQLEPMIEASKHYIGTHDFRSFTKNKALEDTVRTIYSWDVHVEGTVVTMKIIGNGFMHHMIRILVAMLVECGRGKCSQEDIKWILAQKNRVYAPKIAPSAGLVLVRVFYDLTDLTMKS
jgi:tRNA pseudouridine38-40 synthase